MRWGAFSAACTAEYVFSFELFFQDYYCLCCRDHPEMGDTKSISQMFWPVNNNTQVYLIILKTCWMSQYREYNKDAFPSKKRPLFLESCKATLKLCNGVLDCSSKREAYTSLRAQRDGDLLHTLRFLRRFKDVCLMSGNALESAYLRTGVNETVLEFVQECAWEHHDEQCLSCRADVSVKWPRILWPLYNHAEQSSHKMAACTITDHPPLWLVMILLTKTVIKIGIKDFPLKKKGQ